jgi:DNA-binding NarL/FixJ family response regulator
MEVSREKIHSVRNLVGVSMRFMLADANPAVRAALRLVIEQQAGSQVAAEAHDAVNLFAQAAQTCPDVILLDIDLPGLQLPRRSSASALAEFVQALRSICPGMVVIAMSSQFTARHTSLRAKANAFICKSDPPEALLGLLATFLGKEQPDELSHGL